MSPRLKNVRAIGAEEPASFAAPDLPDSREKLLAAALHLFATHGVARVSVRDIASAAPLPGPCPCSASTTGARRAPSGISTYSGTSCQGEARR